MNVSESLNFRRQSQTYGGGGGLDRVEDWRGLRDPKDGGLERVEGWRGCRVLQKVEDWKGWRVVLIVFR